MAVVVVGFLKIFHRKRVSRAPYALPPEVLLLPALFITEITENFSIVLLQNGPESRSVYMK